MIPVSGTLIESDTTQPGVVVAPIAPQSAPLYQPPTDSYIPQDPMVAPTPAGQFRGEGGTPFGSKPPAYTLPLYIQPPVVDLGVAYGDNVPQAQVSKGAVPHPFVLPPAPGKDQVMPVPTGQQPTKQPIPATVDPVTGTATPGPVSGTIAGFDLSRIPFWAWLIGAAVIGSRLLK